MIMKKTIFLLLSTGLIFSVSGCGSKKSADAYGNFEAVEIIVSSEANGKLLQFNLTEGQAIAEGQEAALVDTTLSALQQSEGAARKQSALSRLSGADAQVAVVKQQLENLRIDLRRVQNMVHDDAATQKQLDDLIGAEKVLTQQLGAAQAQRNAIASEIKAIDANLGLIEEQLKRCHVINPVSGTVLEKYGEAFEMTAVGKPLYKIGNLDALTLRVYVSGGQMNRLKIGQECTARIDNGKKYLEFPGVITWISDTAEFTPKIIQTKEERVNLVYAVKVRVGNPDGMIKIGMPGEVIF